MQLPTQFGPYLLLERVSVGGMAEVYKAKEYGVDGFERVVAVKRILPHVAEDDEFIAMFKDEAKIAVQLNHSNIAQIYNLGHEDQSFYIALEYIAGRDVRAIFQKCQQQSEPMPVAQACYVIMKICEGLDYAHNKRDRLQRDLHIVHRDVSPPNLLVSFEGEVKLIDFGVAKAAGRASRTQAGILKGKFGYMSPEQVRGLSLDRRSDVFAVGVVLHEVLTGQRLFQAETDFATLEKVRSVDVPSPRAINPKIPPELEAIIFKALARDRDRRYGSASELHDALQAFMFAQGMFFSRKDLATWMRYQYAREIELEKEKDRAQAGLRPETLGNERDAARPAPRRQRKTMMMTGGPPLPPKSRGRRSVPPPPPPPRRSRVPSRPGAAPVQAVTTEFNRSVRAQPSAPIRVGAGVAGDDFDWDDEELETRLFDEDSSSRTDLSGAQSMLSSKETGVDRPSSGRTLVPNAVVKGDEPVRSGRTLVPSTQSPPSHAQPAGVVPASAGMPMQFAGGPEHVHAPNQLHAPSLPPPRRALVSSLVVGVVVLLLSLGAGVLFLYRDLLFGNPPKGTDLDPSVAAQADDVVGLMKLKVEPANAVVRVDDRVVEGPVPYAVNLPAGKHALTVEQPGYIPKTQTVVIEGTKAEELSIRLEHQEVLLDLETIPATATVTLIVDGRAVAPGVGGGQFKLVRDPHARYEVEVANEGYVAQRFDLVFNGSSRQTIHATLDVDKDAKPTSTESGEETEATPERTRPRPRVTRKPTPAVTEPPQKSSVLKIGTVSGVEPAKIYVDGEYIGETPLPKVRVTPGRHTIKYKWPDGREIKKTVSVDDGGSEIVKAG